MRRDHSQSSIGSSMSQGIPGKIMRKGIPQGTIQTNSQILKGLSNQGSLNSLMKPVEMPNNQDLMEELDKSLMNLSATQNSLFKKELNEMIKPSDMHNPKSGSLYF